MGLTQYWSNPISDVKKNFFKISSRSCTGCLKMDLDMDRYKDMNTKKGHRHGNGYLHFMNTVINTGTNTNMYTDLPLLATAFFQRRLGCRISLNKKFNQTPKSDIGGSFFSSPKSITSEYLSDRGPTQWYCILKY